MTIEKVQKDFDALIAQNSFTLAGYTSDTGNPIYHRMWKRTVQVVVKRNGRQDPKFIRDYSSPKRAMNVIRKIVKFADFEC